MAEAGATVYCLDLPDKPGDTWQATQRYVKQISESEEGIGRLTENWMKTKMEKLIDDG